MHGRAPVHRDTDHAHLGLHGFHRHGNTCCKPPARQRHQDHVEIGPRFDHLGPDRALACNHAGVVEGRDLDKPLGGDQPLAFGQCVILAAADDADLGPEGAYPVYLGLGHQFRHADNCPDAPPRGSPGHPAPMVSCRTARHARHALGQGHDGVHGPAQLERTDGLAGFQLEQELMPRAHAHVRGRHERRRVGNAVQHAAGGMDMGQVKTHCRIFVQIPAR